MDLTQSKLTRAEWESIELSPNEKEIQIMNMIINGYDDLDICVNRTQTLLGFLKMDQSESMDDYLFNKYILPLLMSSSQNNDKINKYIKSARPKTKLVLKSADKIRIQNADSSLRTLSFSESESIIYEFFLANQLKECMVQKQNNNNHWHFYYFTLSKMHENVRDIVKINSILKDIILNILQEQEFESEFRPEEIIYNAAEYIEQNKALLRYKTQQLYPHQKKLFAIIKQPEPKLIMYIAPTGTGKTLSPIGINKKIIFVCAARHIGLALARTAIAVEKKIAFAFGATCADDVRLHYAAATDYVRNRKSGRIQKVDNTKGEKVEIMICDIKSYIPAMLYMLAFNPKEDIVMYWDEVTIGLDYETHDLHDMIRSVWSKNVIPNIVFSSATMPRMHDLGDLRASFEEKFSDGAIHTIDSFDCVKSITMIDPGGYSVLPHTIFEDYNELQRTVNYWSNNGTILRYFDAKEVGNFIRYVENTDNLVKNAGLIRYHFHSATSIDMTLVKQHYLRVLLNIIPEKWPQIYSHFNSSRVPRIVATEKSSPTTRGVFITTDDAYTLTDGPTYFFTEDVHKIAKFYVQQSNIPVSIMEDIIEKINKNSTITKRVEELENTLEDILNKDNSNSDDKGPNKSMKKDGKDMDKNPKIAQLQSQIEGLRGMITSVSLHELFVPNKPEHIKRWNPESNIKSRICPSRICPLYFTSNITDDVVIRIMQLHNIDNVHKILLLMGIGVFTLNEQSLNPAYLEIMKTLASEQRLYLIIANSDFMWGTNYQSCHAYFSKDLHLTQDKIIQGMGRVGRGNVQQEYTVRFRDLKQIRTLLCAIEPEDKMEIVNMNKLFGTLTLCC